MTTPRAALREPMLWLIIGIPLATVIGGLVTLWLAAQDGKSHRAPEPAPQATKAQHEAQPLPVAAP
jgi:gas vesicle protein